MMFASQEPDLLDWLLDVVRMKQGVIAQGLGVGLGISAVYFLVMMLTRWGDRHTLPKALVFSGFIHLVSVAGYVAVVASPSNLPAPKFQTEKEQETEAINVQLFSEDPQQLSKEGNTPVWNEPLKPTEPLMARNDQRNLKPVPFEDPQREVVPLEEKQAPELPDLKPTLPEETPEVPQPIQPNLEPNPRAPADISQEAPELITSPEPQESKIQRQRNAVPQRGPFNTPINRQPMRGATDRVNRDVDPKRELASLETPDDPKAYIKRGPERGVFKHRSSPAPAFGPLPKLGAPDIQGEVETPAGQRVPNRPKRLVNREPLDRIDANIARQKTDRLPDPTDPVRRRTFPPAPINTPDLMDDRITPVPIRPLLNTPRMGRRVALPSTYRYRGPEQRRKAALQFGGSEASERAVEDALKWLAAHQTAEGFWDADAHGAGEVKLARKLVRDEKTGRDVWQEFDDRGANITRENHGLAGPNADSGVTALAILAFLGAGYTHEDGPYAGQVDKALEWLIGQQREDGYLGGKASYFARAYCHGIATYALAEAYGMRSDPTLPSKLKEPLEKAVHYMLVRQNSQTGGWRYLPYDDRPITAQNGQTRFVWNRETDPGDMSIFGWNLMALKAPGTGRY